MLEKIKERLLRRNIGLVSLLWKILFEFSFILLLSFLFEETRNLFSQSLIMKYILKWGFLGPIQNGSFPTQSHRYFYM